ncbi:MAG TPA: hypothetical protein VHE54_07435 [Puia sp.]|nr:hypothetical protein [Puia sp.]
MKQTRSLVFAAALLATLAFAECGGRGRNGNGSSTDTTPTVSAPDNNSANNPSLADTNYEKNRTRPITDTMKVRDTPSRKK